MHMLIVKLKKKLLQSNKKKDKSLTGKIKRTQIHLVEISYIRESEPHLLGCKAYELIRIFLYKLLILN